MKPITYPPRPVNGGPLPKALPGSGQRSYEPKVNGWRALVHVPTGTMFNRQGEELSIAGEFAEALQKLKGGWLEEVGWVDCEALERRHNIGRGTLIVLDYVSHWPALPGQSCARSTAVPYDQRRLQLEMCGLEVHQNLNEPVADNSVYLIASYPGKNRVQFEAEKQHLHLWHILNQCNKALGCEFYEGVVAKRIDSNYPIQLRNPDAEFPYWTKHRWAW